MRARIDAITVLLLAGLVAGCSYSLPPMLQDQVDTLNGQTANVYAVVSSVKRQASEEKVDDEALDNVRTKYNELNGAYSKWLDQVERVITTQIENFQQDDKYGNAVAKLETASNEFEKAADAATGGSIPTDVPDWAVESIELVTMAYNERKMKKASGAIYDQMQMKTWDEIGE